MKMHRIEIDDNVWQHLKKYAEPFEDTPNSVLNRLLFGETVKPSPQSLANMNIQGVPVALSQIFEVIYEMACSGVSRIDATHRVAEKRGTTTQTIVDKYCRQLNKRAHQIDALLSEPGLVGFKALLKDKYTQHSSVIDIFFETLDCEHPPPDIEQEEFCLAELDAPVYSGID
jgi:hypothetical protein